MGKANTIAIELRVEEILGDFWSANRALADGIML